MKTQKRMDKAVEKFKRELEHALDQGTGELASLRVECVHELLEFADAAIDGDIGEAKSLAEDMDTSVRDSIPENIYDFVMEHG